MFGFFRGLFPTLKGVGGTVFVICLTLSCYGFLMRGNKWSLMGILFLLNKYWHAQNKGYLIDKSNQPTCMPLRPEVGKVFELKIENYQY